MRNNRNRRYFPRHRHRTHGRLRARNQVWAVHILDLSFKGALAALIGPHPLQNGDIIELEVDVPRSDPIRMRGTLSHQKAHYLGLECRASGIDDMARLRLLLNQLEQQERAGGGRPP